MNSSVIRGAFYGAAVGDALGGPVEHLTAEEIREKYGKITQMVGGGWLGLEPGEHTDDTSMLLLVAEGILANPASPLEEIGERFIRWYRLRPNDVGKTTAMSLENFLRLGNWKEAARRTALYLNKMDSNGGLMRTLPVTFGYGDRPEIMAMWSAEIASMTHYSQEGSACCIFYNYLVWLAGTVGGNKRELVTRAIEFTHRQCTNLNINPSNFFWYLIKSIQPGEDKVIPRGSALDTLAAAVQAFLYTDSFADALVEVVNRGEDADTAGNITGGLAGAYYGYEAIPSSWIEVLKDKERLEDVIRGFIQLWEDKQKTAGV